MKKRVAAAVLGIMLSVSMGLEVPAAALDSGFESGFTSEQAADVQTEDGAEAVQPSEDTEVPADTAGTGKPGQGRTYRQRKFRRKYRWFFRWLYFR